MFGNKCVGAPLHRFAVRFVRREDGTATVFACFMIMMMLLVGGIGIDLMHNEMERTRLQNTLDRAVLAATDLDQTLDPKSVVEDYFAKAGMSDFLSSVNVSEGLNFRTVNAEANTVSETQFMRLMGVEELRVPARSGAQERISNVEVSLLLDISGSMGWGSNRLNNMKDAAKEFAGNLIRPETEDLISLTVIPYSEQVNVGSDIFGELNTNQMHSYSHCIEFPNDHYSSTELDLSHTYGQTQHFQWNYEWNSWWNNRSSTVCPRWDYEEVTAFSQSYAGLETQINSFNARAGTAIHTAMKWGTAFLDPSTRPIVNSLIADGKVDSSFSGRPRAYDDPDTLKTIVVMTDGKNSASNRIQSWAYDSPSDVVHWANYNLWFYLQAYVSSYNYWRFHQEWYSASHADMLLGNICDAAKAKGIVIWGVGFEVDDHGANVLKDCSSSPSHFFRVEGVEIKEAFKAIASQINQLRLTQ